MKEEQASLYPIGTLMELTKEIVAMRKAAGLTQVELANRAGVGLRFLRELEQGKPTVRMDKVNQVLALFGREFTVRMKP
jgi:y4mF family transcriptional regulator